jgi:hypothetical protein
MASSKRIPAQGEKMANPRRKIDLPVSEIRRYLEPGPIVLVTSAHGDERNIMTMGWHTVMEFTPSLVGSVIAGGNHSFGLIRRSKECVINLPTTAHRPSGGRRQHVGGGDRQVREVQTDARDSASCQSAPDRRMSCLLRMQACGCAPHLEVQFLHVRGLKAHVAASPKHPQTLHYTGDGVFMIAGNVISRRSQFRPGML